ncbi:Fic family protein [Streptomyces sp. NPDC059491]|uniref:Fic family protein n=1 Tax=Streptomyces sp. NPDC059491 TaxID=3346850 RepID=UPI0036C1B135
MRRPRKSCSTIRRPRRPVIASCPEQPVGLVVIPAFHGGRERPGRRPCFTQNALCELHEKIVTEDTPAPPSPEGFRRSTSTVTWADGRTCAIAVAPRREPRGHMERWRRWAERTTAPAVDEAAFGTARLMTIHPLAEGKGRTVRLVAQCDLVAARYAAASRTTRIPLSADWGCRVIPRSSLTS